MDFLFNHTLDPHTVVACADALLLIACALWGVRGHPLNYHQKRVTTMKMSYDIAVGDYVCVRPSYIQSLTPELRAGFQRIRGFVADIDSTNAILRIVVYRPGNHVSPCSTLPVSALMPVPHSPRLDARSTALDHR